MLFNQFLDALIIVVQSLSCVWLFATPLTAACQASLSFTVSQILLKLMSVESVMPSNHIILCCPLLLLPSIFPCVRVFSNESALCFRWPKYWSFSISPTNEYSGLISFIIDWFDLLTVQGTLKRLLQHHTSKASILWCSAFYIVQLSYWYMTTGKTIALARQIFFGKVTSVLFYIFHFHMYFYIFHLYRQLSDKEYTCIAEVVVDVSLIPGSGRFPGAGRGNPLQYSCLENPMDRGAWTATGHRTAKNRTQLKQLTMHACS